MAAKRGRQTRSRLADVAGSALTALLVFAAVPAVLVVVVGDPLHGGLGHHWSHDVRVAMTALAGVAWVAWLFCVAQLARAVVHHVRRGEAHVTVGAPLVDRIAARIAIGILAVTTLGAPAIAVGASAGAAATTATVVHVGASAPPAAAAPQPAAVPSTAPQSTASVPYLVRPGDSLWSIAETQFGDGGEWTTIAALNLGHTMDDGRRFVDPSLIYPGWDLALPASPDPTPASAPVADDLPAPAPAPIAAPSPVVVTPPSGTIAPTTLPATPTVTAPTATTPTTPSAATPVHGATPAATIHGRATGHHASSLPELAALGVGAIACAALARRSRRRRLLQHLSPRPGNAGPSDAAVDADVLLQRFAHVPALAALERANARLGHELHDEVWRGPEPAIRAICVTSFGVDFWLRSASHAPPRGFEVVEDGMAWHVSHHELDGAGSDAPYFPVVLPIGEDADGTWLLPLRAGTCLPLAGPAAQSLWRAARRVQEAWTWADMVLITEDPAVADREVQRYGGEHNGGPPDDLAILYFGDPGALPASTAPFVSVVTTAAVAATDLTVMVDHQGASIHPLAKTVRPDLVAADAARLLDELVDVPTLNPDVDTGAAEDDPHPAWAPEVTPDLADLGPGQVEVKLLTMTPRLEGLSQALPPNRERRAIELVAYLGLHRPDSITSDRLRTRVLGSADADAAAKTLFNTATAARRAMGTDHEGAPLLPPGTRTGHYSLSPAVTVDVQRAAGLAALGNATEDPDLAMAYCRAALELIESEPMANALAGYTWWESEGHGGRIAAVLVHTACNLAALAVQDGRFELAHWGLEQARLLDPYSESLSRAAMQVAAAEGDPDRLRREWHDCQRRIDELDPGSSPSSRTERLYGELAQQALA